MRLFQENRLLDVFTPRVAVEMTAAKGTGRKEIDECLTALGLAVVTLLKKKEEKESDDKELTETDGNE